MDTQRIAGQINSNLQLFRIYNSVEYLSIKHDSYFQVYEELFRQYVGKQFTFVEVGVLNGGSLFMWRKYFGPEARIIGIDLNPATEKWREHGFEIVIGDQSNELFWDDFYQKNGPVDVLLDDGGHTNDQQIVTVHKAIQNVRSGGMVVAEDVHTSYWRGFGNPSPHSFISFSKRIVDSINSRFPSVTAVRNDYGKRVFSVSFYESIVAFKIDTDRSFACNPITNGGISANANDFRYDASLIGDITRWREKLPDTELSWPGTVLLKIFDVSFRELCFLFHRAKGKKLKRFFK